MDIQTYTQHQQAFRRLVDAMSYPGTVLNLDKLVEHSTFKPLLTLIATTLIDNEVSFYVEEDELSDHLHQMTKGKEQAIDHADFVICNELNAIVGLQNAKQGTLDNPDDSATVIIDLGEKNIEGTENITLRGPGINKQKEINIDPSVSSIFRMLQQVNMEYPFGVDTIIINTKGNLLAIPRSTRIQS